MTRAELRYIVARHEKWLRHPDSGEQANLSRANLSWADLSEANLSEANLSEADLSEADLSGANLSRANLSEADLSGADLSGADLSGADLSGADLDYSSWPLQCGSLHAKADDRLVVQLLYHTLALAQNSGISDELRAALDTDALIGQANRFHRADECGHLKRWQKGNECR